MKRADQPEGAFERFARTDEGLAYIESEEFQQRCAQLFEKIERCGGRMTIAECAALAGLPIDVFHDCIGQYYGGLVRAAVEMGLPPTASAH
jgi:hypothetical protein